MAVDPGLGEWVMELFAGLGDLRCRPMFGGLGVYADGLFFALAAGDGVYLKGDDANEGEYRAAGSAPFSYPGKDGGPHVMRYWRLPESVFDDADEALRYLRRESQRRHVKVTEVAAGVIASYAPAGRTAPAP